MVGTLAVCLVSYGLLLLAFRWINQPRDLAVAGGLGLILALLFVVPLVVRTIWRRL
jgi:multisubunit Na+/H+ antiporter MnhB subunit